MLPRFVTISNVILVISKVLQGKGNCMRCVAFCINPSCNKKESRQKCLLVKTYGWHKKTFTRWFNQIIIALFDWYCSDVRNNKRWIKTDKRISNFLKQFIKENVLALITKFIWRVHFHDQYDLHAFYRPFLYKRNWENTLKAFNWVGLLFYMVSSWLSKVFCYRTYFTMLQNVFYPVTKRILPCYKTYFTMLTLNYGHFKNTLV